MKSKRGTEFCEAFPMNGGDGDYSYAKNSIIQRRGIDTTKNIVKEAILDKLDSETLLQNSSNVFRIADLGCSVGPNTFFVVQNIIEAVNLKLQSQRYGLDNLEFQAFFNDHVGNDFNTLFKSLPEEKQYYAAVVPGSFHGRLFPESSIHFFYSSYAIQYLSKIPKEIVDRHSPAYNKGKVYFTTATKKVREAYSAQFARDMESFLNSRALELVSGGLMALLVPCAPPNSKNRIEALANLLGDALVDTCNKGLIKEELIDSFNMPLYTPAPEELKTLMENNGNFNIENMEPLYRLGMDLQEHNVDVQSKHLRSIWEGIVKEHFGEEVLDEVFEQCKIKLAKASIYTDPSYKPMGVLFVIKRKFA